MFRNAGFWKITQAVLPENRKKSTAILAPHNSCDPIRKLYCRAVTNSQQQVFFFVNLFTTTIISTFVSVY